MYQQPTGAAAGASVDQQVNQEQQENNSEQQQQTDIRASETETTLTASPAVAEDATAGQIERQTSPDSTTSYARRQQQSQQQSQQPHLAGNVGSEGGELAELTTAEISLDLQNLIEEASFDFAAAAVAAASQANPHQTQGVTDDYNVRQVQSPGGGSSGSNSPSAQSSPASATSGTTGSTGTGQDSPPDFHLHQQQQQQYRPSHNQQQNQTNVMSYGLPGSVHPPPNNHFMSVNNNNNNNGVQVKQEPMDHNHGRNGAVSSTTTMMFHHSNNNNMGPPPMGPEQTGGGHPHFKSLPQAAVAAAAAQQQQINDSTLASTDIDSLVTRPAQQQHKYLQHHPQYQYPHHPGTNQATAPTPTTTTTTNLQKGVVKSPANGGRLPERNSDEYRKRRERNNVAVRKSREKAKIRSRDTEERVKVLARENDRLVKKAELLQEELSVLRSLFSTVGHGVLPDHVHRDLSRKMENFQQQHNAIAQM